MGLNNNLKRRTTTLVRRFSLSGDVALFYAYLLLPILFINTQPVVTRSIRLLGLTILVVAGLSIESLRRTMVKNYRTLPPLARLFVIILFAATIASCLNNLVMSPIRSNNIWFGTPPEFMGVLAWLLFIGLGLLFRDIFKRQLLTRATFYILSLASTLPSITELYYIIRGFRIAGIMFHPTSMSIYATIAIILGLHQLTFLPTGRKRTVLHTLLVLGSCVTVLLTQSRIGYLVLLATLSIWAVCYLRRVPWLSLCLGVIVVVFAVIPRIQVDYFQRFQDASVNRGVDYRLDLYSSSAKEIASKHLIIGNGPDTLPGAINNQDTVSEDVAKSLRKGVTFVSTHDLYFDVAYFFGVPAVIGLSGLTLLAFRDAIRRRQLTFVLLLAALVANATVNVPSLELTSLYWIVILGVVGSSTTPIRSYLTSFPTPWNHPKSKRS